MYWAIGSAIYRRAVSAETGLIQPCDWMQSRWWVDSEWEEPEIIRLSPSGRQALLQTGEILDLQTRETVARVPVRATDMAWLNDETSFVTVSEASQGRTVLEHWRNLTIRYNEVEYKGRPLYVGLVGDQVILVTQVGALAPTFHVYFGSADSDGDGVAIPWDKFPNDPAAARDTDRDGFPDEWNEGYNAEDSTTNLDIDAFPLDSACQYSHQADEQSGLCNTGVAYPTNAPESFAVDHDGGTIYMLVSDLNRIFRWSVLTKKYENPIFIGKGSEQMTLSEDSSNLYLLYDTGAVTKLDVGSGIPYPEEVLIATLPGMPYAIQAFGNFIFVVDRQAARVLSKEGEIIDALEDNIQRIDGLVWSKPSRRMYQYSSHYGISGGPEYYELDPVRSVIGVPDRSEEEANEIGSCESSYSPSAASKCIRESYDGSFVVLCEDSRVYDATSPWFCYTGYELVSYNPQLTDVLWLPDGTVLTQRQLREDQTEVQYFRSDFKPGNEYIVEGFPLRLLHVNGRDVLVVTHVNGTPRFQELDPSLLREIAVTVDYEIGVLDDASEESFLGDFIAAMDSLALALVEETYTDDIFEDAAVEGDIQLRIPTTIQGIDYTQDKCEYSIFCVLNCALLFFHIL